LLGRGNRQIIILFSPFRTGLTGKCPVPPKRDRREQGAQLKRYFLPGKPRRAPRPGEVAWELQIRRRFR